MDRLLHFKQLTATSEHLYSENLMMTTTVYKQSKKEIQIKTNQIFSVLLKFTIINFCARKRKEINQ
jgi:hypothetical protein